MLFLPLPSPGPQGGLLIGIDDSLLAGLGFDLLGPAGESLQRGTRNPGQLPARLGPLDCQPLPGQLLAQSHMELGFEITGIPLQVAELTCLPGPFLIVKGRVEHEAVSVKMRIGDAIDGPGSEVDELTPDHIAGGPIFVLPLLANPRLHLCFDVGHRFSNRVPKRRQEAFIAGQPIQQRHTFRHMEVEVIPDPPRCLLPQRERLTSLRMLVLTQRLPVLGLNGPTESQPLGPYPLPSTDQLLPLAVVVSSGIVTLRLPGRRAFNNAEHTRIVRRNQ